MLKLNMEGSWHEQLKEELALPYVEGLQQFLLSEAQRGAVIYPPEPLVFHALKQTPFHKVKVVIVGQDPYHGEGQAHGLSFSVPCGVPLPPSLRNIFRELYSDLGVPCPKEGCLTSWAKQGVLLLNATLTVRAAEPGSHRGRGWERLTSAMIARLAQRKERMVFLLWGRAAQEKCACIGGAHAVLTAAHPSPYSAVGFFGSRPFSKVNALLREWGGAPIDWASIRSEERTCP